MRSYKLVKEFGEGVDRMFREMEAAGCPAPEYRQNEFMVYATIRQHKDARTEQADQTNGQLNGGLNDKLYAPNTLGRKDARSFKFQDSSFKKPIATT